MSMLSKIRKYWRVIVLVLLLLFSGAFLFGIVGDGNPSDQQTLADSPNVDDTALMANSESFFNLKFGLDLAGGTRLRAPVVGITAEGMDQFENPREVETTVASALPNASPSNVRVRTIRINQTQAGAPTQPTVKNTLEVTAENVTKQSLQSALEETGLAYENIRDGLTETTREETVRVLNDKINKAGLSGGTARSVVDASGSYYILIEMPNQNREAVRELVNQRGKVQIDIYYPTTNGTYSTREVVLEREDFRQIGAGTIQEGLGPHVPVTIQKESAERFRQAVIETGVASVSSTPCTYDRAPNSTGPCLLTKVDGEVVYSAGMAPSLASSMRSGEWVKSPSFVLQTRSQGEASELSINLRAGALPAKLDVDEGTSTYISPTQGDRFKTSSIIVGLLAVFGVTIKVFYKYRDARVAIPMLLTALSEVVILLGLASVIKYPIDLAVVGGFIAVVGTGVDDLIIISNEILAKGGVTSQRLFQSRFKRAFWVIGAAAATTIIAMSPLIFLSLGDLRGFAIFTAIGVVIGISITRPAYGDILEYLILKNQDN